MITTAQQTAENYLFGPMDLAFLQPVRLTDFVYYGYGSCTGRIVLSPAPTCLVYTPPVASVPPTTELPPPWHPPINPDPPTNVPVPGTLLLLALGLVAMKMKRWV